MIRDKTERRTAELFDLIWSKLDAASFKAMSALYSHLVPTDIRDEWFRGRMCLDAGCGSGRYLYTLAGLGVNKAFGIDIGSLDGGKALRKTPGFQQTVELVQANVLDLPFASGSFDFVNCCGVLHITLDPFRAFQELARVCKPRGFIAVGVYGRGGIAPLLIQVSRELVRRVPFETLDRLLANLMPASILQGRVLDNLCVPIQNRYSEQEILRWFQTCSLVDVRRIEDNHVRRFRGPFWKLIVGEAWIQVMGRKPAPMQRG